MSLCAVENNFLIDCSDSMVGTWDEDFVNTRSSSTELGSPLT